MDLLVFARGPMLAAALTIFVVGIAWRLGGLYLFLHRRSPLSPARNAGVASTGWRAIFTRMVPRKHVELRASATLVTINPYIFHIGLAIVAFGYLPHIVFVRRLTNIAWPALPDVVIYLAAAATIVSLLIALLFRLTDPVLKLISSFDDYFTWIVTMLPLITGMALISEPSAALMARSEPYSPALVAMHLLSLELLLIWFPFGKLMHAVLFVPARAQLGTFMARRGVKA
jgi:nitrate reductase gamma subunit